MPRRIYSWFVGLFLCWAFWRVFEGLNSNWFDSIPWGHGDAPFLRGAHVTNLLLALIAAFTVFAAMLPQRVDGGADGLRRGAIVVALLAFLAIHLDNWRMGQKTAWILEEDVATTTMASDRLVLRGLNPYVVAIDTNHPRKLLPTDGYKYLPVTMAAYLPALAGRDPLKAFLTVNLAISLLLGAVVCWCGWTWISADAGLLCGVIYLMPRIISVGAVVRGNIDLVPVLLAMLALRFSNRRLLAGVLVGLSIAAKLFPGPLWIAVLLTRGGNKRFLAGVVLGALPILPFFVWNPAAFVGNIFVYPFTRYVEINSVWFGLPRLAELPAQAAFLCVCVAVGRHNLRFEVSPINRCIIATLLSVCLLLVSPASHANYFIWWFAPLCVTVAYVAFNSSVVEWLGAVRRG